MPTLFIIGEKYKIWGKTNNWIVFTVMTIPKEMHEAKNQIWVLTVIFSIDIVFLLHRNIRLKLTTLNNIWKPFENYKMLHKCIEIKEFFK